MAYAIREEAFGGEAMRRIEASHKGVKGLEVENFMVKTTI
jgi:hypothetical protein